MKHNVCIPQFNSKIINIVCLIDNKCLLVYPTFLIVVDLENPNPNTNSYKVNASKLPSDFTDLSIDIKPYQQGGFAIKTSESVMLVSQSNNKVLLRSNCKLIGTQYCQIFLIDIQSQVYFNLKRYPLQYYLHKSKTMLTADGQHLLETSDFQHLKLTAISTQLKT